MKLVFMLRSGIIEWQIPSEMAENFSFNQVACKVRLDGFFMSNDLYVRHEELIGMSLADGKQTTPVFKGTLQ